MWYASFYFHYLSCVVNVFSTKPRDWLGRTSPKWLVFCRVGRKTFNRSIALVHARRQIYVLYWRLLHWYWPWNWTNEVVSFTEALSIARYDVSLNTSASAADWVYSAHALHHSGQYQRCTRLQQATLGPHIKSLATLSIFRLQNHLWMTSCFHIMDPLGQNQARRCFEFARRRHRRRSCCLRSQACCSRRW